MTWLITFSCYGTRLPGDERGSVERTRQGRGRFIAPSILLEAHAAEEMTQPRYILDPHSANLVLQEIQRDCAHRGWALLAAHVRSTHVHVVAEGFDDPDRAMGEFKAYASRVLNIQDGTRAEELKEEGPRKHWARGGSTRRLPDSQAIANAVRYVADGQGAPTAVFVAAFRNPITPVC